MAKLRSMDTQVLRKSRRRVDGMDRRLVFFAGREFVTYYIIH